MQDNNVKLSAEQVNAVMEYAAGLYASERFGFGAYSPWMSNSLLVGLNNDSKIPTSKKIKDALGDSSANAKELQAYTDFMRHFDAIFERTLYSYVNALSMDMTIYCNNAYTQDEYKSDEYIADKRRFYDFLEKFDYRKEFRNVLMNVMTHETYYTWFRKTKWGNKGMKLALQVMPQDYCMLTGYWEKGMLFDFDMNYFLQAGVDIDGYDPIFKKYYTKTFGVDGKIDYNYRPSNTLKNRTGAYANWTQTSPEDGAWVFKMQPDNFAAVPFLAPMLVSAMENSEVEALQKSKDIASAYGLLMGEIRLFDNAKSGTTANQFAIDPKTLANFMGMVKAGLGDTAKAVAMPTENTKYYQFEDKNPNMTATQLSTSAGQGTGISRVIYSSDRMSSAEVEGAQTEVYNIMRPMYRQFENFLNFFGNKLTKKYHFTVVMDGSNYRWERQQRMDGLMKLSDKGMILNSTAYAAALGYTPMQFDHMLDEGKYGDFNTKWQMLLNVNTSSNNPTGRPQMDGGLSDSGEMNRDE